MSHRSCPFALLFVFGLSVQATAQQPVAPTDQAQERDPQALAIVQSAVRAMGGTVPSDTTVTGTVTIVAGSQTSSGTIRILTRGTDQTSESITLPQSSLITVYSQGAASEVSDANMRSLSLERSATSQSLCFPLPFLVAALANVDEAIQYVGLESLGQHSVQHIHLRDTFASNSELQSLSDFTTFDLWIDQVSGLPLQISGVRRDGGGSYPRIPFDVSFSDYRSVSGIMYPFSVQKSLNGTLWMSVNITDVVFNTGLTDSNFAIR